MGPALVGEGMDVHGLAACRLELPVEGVGELLPGRARGDRSDPAAQVARLPDAKRVAPEHHQVIADHEVGHGLDARRLLRHGERVGRVHLACGKR